MDIESLENDLGITNQNEPEKHAFHLGSNMKPLFVGSEGGDRAIHWGRLFVFSVGLALVAAAITEGLAFFFTGALSTTALVAVETVVVLILARVVIHALAYEPSDVDEAASV